jgi:hypothetical protein
MNAEQRDERLFKTDDDFHASLDEGMKIIMGPLTKISPLEIDLPDMKKLMAVYLTATVPLDPKVIEDPDFQHRIDAVRMVLLAAYNMGRRAETSLHNDRQHN